MKRIKNVGGGGDLRLIPTCSGVEKDKKISYNSDKLYHIIKVFFMRKRIAFTLAEVLITLGIIGIVAALTMPTLISLYQKKIVETRLEHTYSLVSQALKMAEADYGDSQYWMRDIAGPQDDAITPAVIFLETYFLPYIKGYKTGIVGGTGLYQIGYNSRYIGNVTTKSRYVCLNNGVNLFFGYNVGRQGIVSVPILIDINGPKSPNILGRDLFEMTFSLYDGILFMSGERRVTGYGLTYNQIIKYDDIYTRCKNGGYGALECGALIKQNGWKIPKDYPYRI